MNWQRIVFAGCALAMAPTVFMPWMRTAVPLEGDAVWIREAIPLDRDVQFWGTDSALIKTACGLLVIVFAAVLFGKREQRVSVVTWLITFLVALFSLAVAAFTYAWCTFPMFDGTEQLLHAEMLWADYGSFVMMFGSVIILLVAVISPFTGRSGPAPESAPEKPSPEAKKDEASKDAPAKAAESKPETSTEETPS